MMAGAPGETFPVILLPSVRRELLTVAGRFFFGI